MSLRFEFRQRRLAIVAAIGMMAIVGCRQVGMRSPTGGSTLEMPSAPVFSPSESTGPSLPDIPPPPPSAAQRSWPADEADESAPRRLSWSRYLPTLVRPSAVKVTPSNSIATEPVALPEIEATAATDTATLGEELALLVPPALSNEEETLVPSPSDAEDPLDEPFELSTPAKGQLVELDVTEFLIELEQTPAPIKAVTMDSNRINDSMVEKLPAISSVPQSLNAPQPLLESWPVNGANHGITVTPGPTGTGNRLEVFPLSPWTRGPVAPGSLPVWGSLNQWAGQNSDWGGRQFR